MIGKKAVTLSALVFGEVGNMYLTLVTLSCSLVAQVAADAPLVPVQSPERHTSPAQIVAEALTLPEGAALAGRPLTLLKALSLARGSRQPIEAAHAYWRLTRAVAEYRCCWDEYERLSRIEARPEDAAMLQTALASSVATLRVAEVSAISAQHDLAEAAMLSAGAPLPLPADLPHLGTYRTYYDEVFSMRNPPARARLIHRRLPIHRQAIEVRSSAVQAARDVLQAATEAYLTGKADLAEVLSSLRQLGDQHRALLAAVCSYNHDIADYAVSVAGPQTDAHVLVAMLITPSRREAEPAGPERDATETTRPAAAQFPAASSSRAEPATLTDPGKMPGVDEPTPAASPGQLRSVGPRTPTLAPIQEPRPLSSTGASPGASSGEPEPPVAETPGKDAPDKEVESAEPSVSEPPELPAPTKSPEPTARTANKPAVDDPGVSQPALEYYPALAHAKPILRPKLLTEAMHGIKTLPEPRGEPIELRDCLGRLSEGDRRRMITAYWLAAQRGAEYQALVDQLNFLDALVPPAFERRNEPPGAEAMLQLRAARFAAQADLLQAHLDLLDAQFQLTRGAGRPPDSPWLVPATLPHAGPYRLKLEAQPRELAASWPVRRLAAVIPALADGLRDRAAAVVQADAARAAATRAYRAGTQPVGPLLASIKRQTEQTRAFLETLTRYNEAIADYALAVLPASIPAEQLAGTLVVIR